MLMIRTCFLRWGVGSSDICVNHLQSQGLNNLNKQERFWGSGSIVSEVLPTKELRTEQDQRKVSISNDHC